MRFQIISGETYRPFVVDGEEIWIGIPKKYHERFDTQHFRGAGKKLAGNFGAWNTFLDFLADPDTQEILGEELSIIKEKNGDGRYRICIDYPDREIGWESTLHASQLEEGEADHTVSVLSANRNWCANFFEAGFTKAQVTDLVTMSVEITGGVIKVHTMYPGEDVGRLNGDMTTKKGLYFFDFNNPGE